MGNVDTTGARLLPLCVDLDGTLVRSDTLVESLFVGLHRPGIWVPILRSSLHGRAALKQKVAELAPVDAAQLPYNEELLDYLRVEKSRGRELVLATAADRVTAEAVSAHLQLFDSVLASDGMTNLKGESKAAALVELFGDRGFVYAGNDRNDLAVWAHASAAVVVNAGSAIAAQAARSAPLEAHMRPKQSQLRSVLKALRPYQWVKNFLVLVPIATAHALADPVAWAGAAWAFAAFCATASGVYVINDLSDLKADRLHKRKRHRPFASGALSPFLGLAIAGVCLIAGAIFGAVSGALPLVLLYAATSLSYSLWLKVLPLVDVFLLAGLYSLRLFAGGEATGHQVSLALLGFSGFFFLGLAFVKRVSEMMTMTSGKAARRGYAASDLSILQIMSVASGFTAVVVLAQFVQNEATSQRYASPALLWCTVPLMLFWQCRIWLSTARGYMHDDPIVYAAKDWASWLVAIAVFATLVIAKTVTIGF